MVSEQPAVALREPCTSADLAAAYGTPTYVYDLDVVDACAADLRRALPDGVLLCYSLKANPHPLVAGTLRASGCRAEISSPGELAAARAAGFRGRDCLYTGPGKSEQEIRAALAEGVSLFSVESVIDYRRVTAAAAARGMAVDCIVRVNSLRAHGGSGLRMTGVASQFGVDADALVAHRAEFAERPGGRVVGLHFFSLSNAIDADVIAAEVASNAAEAARLAAAAGIDLRVLDLGGGFAAPYARSGARYDYQALRLVIEGALDEHLPGWRRGSPAVAFESGRYLAGACGRLVARVVDVKRSGDRAFVVLDTGIHHLGGLAGLGRLLPVAAEVVPSGGGGPEGTPLSGRASVVGPLCTPADTLSRDAALTGVRPGDLVEIANTGAYGLTASLVGFLSRDVAAEVVLRDGVVVDASRLRWRRTPLAAARPFDQPATDFAEGDL